jgi:hypothetical protein
MSAVAPIFPKNTLIKSNVTAAFEEVSRLTSTNVNIVNPYRRTIALPNVPVIHPYMPLGKDEVVVRHDTNGIPKFSFTAKWDINIDPRVQQSYALRLPGKILDILDKYKVNTKNVDCIISFQNNPWINEPLLFRPHPWLHPDAPGQVPSGMAFNKATPIVVCALNIDPSTEGNIITSNPSTHSQDYTPPREENVVFSPYDMVMGDQLGIPLPNDNRTYNFFTICIVPGDQPPRAAVTFHVLLNTDDQIKVDSVIQSIPTPTTIENFIERIKSQETGINLTVLQTFLQTNADFKSSPSMAERIKL